MTYWFEDFDLDDSSDEIPNKYILTIFEGPPEEMNEVAVIVHRATDRYPIDSGQVNQKRDNGLRIVKALNLLERVESGECSVKDNETGDWIA